jgi:hypothetical protein
MFVIYENYYSVSGKGKVCTVCNKTANTRSRGIALLHSLTSVEGRKWLTSLPGCCLTKKEPQCLSTRRLGGPQSQSGHFGDEKNLLLPPEFDPWTVQSVAWLLYWLCYARSLKVLHFAAQSWYSRGLFVNSTMGGTWNTMLTQWTGSSLLYALKDFCSDFAVWDVISVCCKSIRLFVPFASSLSLCACVCVRQRENILFQAFSAVNCSEFFSGS